MGVGITPLERISERTQIVDVPVPQTLEETVEAMEVLFLQFRDGIVEVFELIPPERISERTSEHIVDVPAPQILREIVEGVKITLQERILERTSARIVDGCASAADSGRAFLTVSRGNC